MTDENKTIKKSVLDRIALARQEGQECLYTKTENIRMEMLSNLQVAKEGSANLFQNMAIFKVGDQRWCVNYDKVLPSGVELSGEGIENTIEYSVRKISTVDAVIVVEAVEWYKNNKGYNLNPYTALFTICALQGLNIVKEGYLEG